MCADVSGCCAIDVTSRYVLYFKKAVAVEECCRWLSLSSMMFVEGERGRRGGGELQASALAPRFKRGTSVFSAAQVDNGEFLRKVMRKMNSLTPDRRPK